MNFTTEKARQSETKAIEAGIHENVILEPIRIGSTNNGKPFIELNLVFENGFSMTFTEFTPIPFTDQTQEEAEERAFNRLVSIMDVYPEMQNKNIDAETFAEAQKKFVDNLSALTTRAATRLRVVLVNGGNGYLRLPNGLNKGKNKFIELMTGDEISKTNHKFGEKQQREETKQTNEAKVSTNLEDLPF